MAFHALDRAALAVRRDQTLGTIMERLARINGRRSLVEPLSLAAAAAGADGIIVEVHPDPEAAICDGPQQLRAGEFAAYADKVQRAAAVAGKSFRTTPARTAA